MSLGQWPAKRRKRFTHSSLATVGTSLLLLTLENPVLRTNAAWQPGASIMGFSNTGKNINRGECAEAHTQ